MQYKKMFYLLRNKKGKILLTWVNVTEYDGKLSKNRDWCELLIEKGSDGKWVAVDINWNPQKYICFKIFVADICEKQAISKSNGM